MDKPQNEANWYKLYLLAYNGQRPKLSAQRQEGEILAITYGKLDWDLDRNPATWPELQVRILQSLD